jgi:hypothetical protein
MSGWGLDCALKQVLGMALLIPLVASARQAIGVVPLQPLAQHVRRLEETLSFVGQPLPTKTHEAINQAIASPEESVAVAALQNALDPLVLITVDINPESRVKVERGPAEPVLVQGGSRFFLVKVLNRAGVTAELSATSLNSGRVFIRSTGDPAL